MKKTMIFENEFDYDNWFEANEEKEGGHAFIEDRVVIVKGTRTIQNRKFNGFSADATINCKNVKTAIRRFIKELKSNGFNVSEDEFESNVHCFTDCGYVVEIEEIDDDRFYINYMCYQNEVEEEATETETKRKRKPITTDIDMIKDFPEETAQAKSLLNTAYGITAESVTPTPTEHIYEIRVFKDGAFSYSNNFSLEKFAEYAFAIMELNSIDFPEPCFKVIQLFKDGKPVKRSVINFGVKVNNQTGEKWQIINENTLDSIMKIFKCVQGKCRERIVVDGDHLNDILFEIYKYLMINDLLADKKPKKIHYDFRHMYPNNCISLPESTHFTIIYNRGFFYIDLNSIKRGFCPNRKNNEFFL